MKKFVAMLAIFLASSLIGMADTLNEGLSFFKKGDYDSAIKWLKPFAEQGNVEVQIELGRCFLGKCDYGNAIKWLKPFAEQGNVAAQNWLKQCLIHSKRK